MEQSQPSNVEKKVRGGLGQLFQTLDDRAKESSQKEENKNVVEQPGEVKTEVTAEVKPVAPPVDQSKLDEEKEKFKYKPLEELDKEELIKITKSFQSQKDKTTSELQKVAQFAKSRDEQLQSILSDPIGFIKEYVPELAANIDYSEQTINQTLATWQANELLPHLAKAYPNEVVQGWRPVGEDIGIPGTPSYDFFNYTNDKRNQLRSMVGNAQARNQQVQQMDQQMASYVDQKNVDDIAKLRSEFDLTEDEMKEIANEFDKYLNDPNDPFPENHPQRVRNMIRGVFYDRLTEKKIQKRIDDAVKKVHDEYRAKGKTLDKAPLPVDITRNIPQETQPAELPAQANRYVSPMQSLFNRTLKT